MDLWLRKTLEEVRVRLTPDDEGSLWLLLFDEPLGAPLIASAFDGAMAHVNAQMVRNIALIIAAAPGDAILAAVPRRNGLPRPVDRQLWRDLRALLDDASPRLLDLVVVGDQRSWSARESDGNLNSAA